MEAGRSVGVGRSVVLFSAAIVAGMATGAASLHAGARQDERVARSPRPVIYTSVGQDESPRLDALLPIEGAPSNLGRTNPLASGLGGAVGPDHYVQTLGSAFAIYDKAGAKVYPQGLEPAAGDTLWQGFGGTCENTNGGNLTVMYDRRAGRWMMSQLAASGNSALCIAISETSDPTGPWFRYAFAPFGNRRIDNPRFGIWPDGYYMTVDQSRSFSPSAGAGVVAFERESMLAGLPARAVYFDLSARGSNAGRLLPSDLDGGVMPPDGSPNYFVQLDDEAWGYDADQLEIYKFHVDWKVPSKSTFTGPSIIDLSAPGIGFDSTPERLIHRLAYRNFGDHESLVFDHSVRVNGADHAGIRWYEMRSPGSAPAIYQAGTYAPDADNRWNGSIAMDAQGNIALAYAVSSESTYASMRYAGRLARDPLGTLPQNEITLGGGSVSRAFKSGIQGEFGAVTVDPADDCTFWLAHGYIQSSDGAPSQTRITSFKFPSCAAVPAGADERASTKRGEAAAINAKISGAGDASRGARIKPGAGETSVTLAWDANTEPDVAGYEVSYGTQSMVYSTVIDAGNVTSQPLAISPGSVYYFAVRAYTSVTPRLYSPYSAEVSYTAAPPIIISLVANRKSPVDLDGATSFASTFPFTADGVSSIVWTATAWGGVAPLQYQFQRFSAATRLYTIVQDWSTANTFVWTPTPAEAGRYFIRVDVRSNGATVAQASRWTSGFDIK